MELKQLNFFLAVAEDLHFGRAAERMYIAQPALSQHVRRLERELGVELFDRRGRNVRLTAAGRAFVDEARRVVEQSERAASVARRASDGITGTLSIGYYPAMSATITPELVQSFLETAEDLSVQISADSPSALEEAIFRGDIDLAITSGPVTRPGLEQTVIASSPIVAAVLSGHPFNDRRFIGAADLEEEPLILTGRSADQRLFDTIVAACHDAGFTARATHVVENPQLVLPAVLCGLGVGVLPAMSTATYGGDLTRSITISGVDPIEVVLVRRIDRTDPSVMAFWDATIDRIESNPFMTGDGLDLGGDAFAGDEGARAFSMPRAEAGENNTTAPIFDTDDHRFSSNGSST